MKLIAFLLVIVVIAWFFLRRRKKEVVVANPKKHGKFHCVSIHYEKGACQAVQKLAQQRILSSEAPNLPLINCDSTSCRCRFEHHEDRRVGDRRGPYNKTLEEVAEHTMQMRPRSGKDRRQSHQ